MTSKGPNRPLAICWAVALLASLALWASSYLNYSHYSRRLAYGFLRGAFIVDIPQPGQWPSPICPPDISWYWGTYTPDDTTCYVVIKRGQARPYWRIDGTHAEGSLMRIDGRWTYYGFSDWETMWTPTIPRNGMLLPLWIPVLLLLITAVRPVWRARLRAKRTARGECLSCGYCLTGNTSGVCPECGTALERKRGHH